MPILDPALIKRANSGVGSVLPDGASQILRLKPTEEGYSFLSRPTSSRREYSWREITRFDKETGEKLLALQKEGEEILEHERAEEQARSSAAEERRQSRSAQDLCPECGGEISVQVVREIPADPNANPVKTPVAYYGGWEMKADCLCGEQLTAWTKKAK